MDKQLTTLATTEVSRRNLLGKAVAGAVAGAAALAIPNLAGAQGNSPNSIPLVAIHELQANFHLAKNLQDLDFMMSLWADDATFGPHVGKDAIRAFLATTGSFTHLRFSLSPSYKTRVEVNGNEAFLYFE